MALTNAEKLQAISTPRALVRYLLKTYLPETTLGHPDIAWDNARGRDFQVFATVIYVIAKWNKKTGLDGSVHSDHLRTWWAEGSTAPGKLLKGSISTGKGDPLQDAFKKNMIKTFDIVVKLATNRKYNFGFRSSRQIAPTLSMHEMAAVFVLVHVVFCLSYKKK
ncbi:hypothetical protein L218DRAFT_1004790 [Marasmius fiardii PR-910]|nr:hypothetical protein L218DRAFT_1004790 [Marasmius fiardii PR-910]